MTGIWKMSATESDNVTLDGMRLGGLMAVIGAALGILVFLLLSVLAFFSDTRTFDMQAFGVGFLAILGGIATFMGAMGVTKRLEPVASTTTTTTTTDSTTTIPVAPPELPRAPDQPRAKRGRQ